ncbi:DUF4190 domain-containing protein [Microbacterium sp. PMB16]|uniref:DUF4190 domain-containing protein n=1 Tax=Microbacterium sp. PMB16 TaxID=3120157 RepID=UPI003F4B685D
MTNPQPPDSPHTPPAFNGTPSGDPSATYPAAYAGGPSAYAPAPPAPPGRTLAIVGLVLAFLVSPVGLILSIVAAVKLGKAGAPKGLAIAGIIVGAVITIIWVIVIILMITVFAGLFAMCTELGAGVWEVDGVTYTCGGS